MPRVFCGASYLLPVSEEKGRSVDNTRLRGPGAVLQGTLEPWPSSRILLEGSPIGISPHWQPRLVKVGGPWL